ncbi:MAG: WXG100 family type VII secretion target [Nocardioides sp.]
MADLNVTYAEMESAASNLVSGKADIEARLTQLKANIDNLVSSGYVTGKSSPAFHAAYDEFNTGVLKTIEGLDGMSQFLTAAARAMSDTDEQLANAIR